MRALAFLRSLAVSLGSVGVITLVSAPGASAEAVDYNTWLSTTTDAQGVPLEHYQNLPLDRGDIFHPSLALLADVMSFVWGIHFSLVTSLLWLLQYLLSFEWVALLVDPIQPIAGQVQGLLAELNWVAFASTIAGSRLVTVKGGLGAAPLADSSAARTIAGQYLRTGVLPAADVEVAQDAPAFD